tara:strand:+ start:24 stop:545 length:522 start_codon:yes stop_codon:yes gene_type:complete
MKKFLLLSAIYFTALIFMPVTSFASNSIVDYYYVPVISVEPVVKTIKSYHRENYKTCSFREVNVREKDPMLILLGTTVGATIGNVISKEKALGTGIGAITGAVITANSRKESIVKRIDVCEDAVTKTHEDRVIGYDVTFEVDGRMFTTRMKNDPGSQLKIKEVKRIMPMESFR